MNVRGILASRPGFDTAPGALIIGALVAAGLVAGSTWWWLSRAGDDIVGSRVPLVRVSQEAPQYAAHVDGGILVRRGAESRILPDGMDGVWLDDGRFLVESAVHPRTCAGVGHECDTRRYDVVDLDSGSLTRWPVDQDWTFDLPDQAVHRLDLLLDLDGRVVSYSPDLRTRTVIGLPPYDGEDDAQRYFGAVDTIGDATFVRFSDVVGEEHTETYGYLRIEDDRTRTVLVQQRLVALWVSSDGAALLGLQQDRGEPCGGCIKDQRIIEIDPETGRLSRVYGVPDDYDKTWRVDRIDKVGDRIAVRYVDRCAVRLPGTGCRDKELGLWVYDGHWSMEPGSDRVRAWWQGPDDRIEASLTAEGGDGALWWVHEHRRTRLPGALVARPRSHFVSASVTGALLPPKR
jgi:hypothetical protein